MPKLSYKQKRFRDPALAVIARANSILNEYAEQGYDLTLRQLYYQFVARGLIANRQEEYNKLGSIVSDARMAGLIDWDHITDRTRNRRGRFVYHRDSPADATAQAARLYATDLWASQPARVEAWVEKDALIGVLESACWSIDVPYFSCRGYTSQSEMWATAQRILGYFETGQEVVILHLGDHDPSGIDMTRDIDERLLTFLAIDHWRNDLPGSTGDVHASVNWVRDHFTLNRIALNMDQVEQYEPPPNPAKMTDSRFAGYRAEYGGQSWELDALEPTVIGELIAEAVEEVRDDEAWQAARAREEEHRALLQAVSNRWEDVRNLLNGKG